MKTIFIFLCFLLMIEAKAQPGKLDSSFGANGIVLTAMPDGYPECYASVLQPDGKIIVSGRFTPSDGFNDGFMLVRYLTDGSIDTTFGDSGRVVTDFDYVYEGAYKITMQPDGKILAAGSGFVSERNPNYNILIARYNRDGSLDQSFGINGKVILDYGLGNDGVGNILVLPDGKIMVCGDVSFHVVTLARYNSNGVLDESFGNNGTIVTDLGEWPIIRDAALQTDGKLVMAGSIGTGGGKQFLLLRYNADGILDATFGAGGVVITDFDVFSEELRALTLQKDGKIVAVGYTGNGSTIFNQIALVRYNSNGLLDPSFGKQGKVATIFENRFSDATDVVLDNAGKIVISSRYYDLFSPVNDFAILRYKDSGTLDSTFGEDGMSITDLAGYYENAYSILIDDFGKIYLSGWYESSDGWGIALSRYIGDKMQPPLYVRIKQILHRHGITWQDKPDNINYYSVQRSTNGNAFTEVARIVSSHNGAVQTYEATDNTTATYRVAAVSNTGNITYSNTLTLAAGNTIDVKLYPNPAKNNLQIEGLPAGAKTTLTITDLSGNTRIAAIANSTTYSLNITQLIKGSYIIKIESGSAVVTKQFIKE